MTFCKLSRVLMDSSTGGNPPTRPCQIRKLKKEKKNRERIYLDRNSHQLKQASVLQNPE